MYRKTAALFLLLCHFTGIAAASPQTGRTHEIILTSGERAVLTEGAGEPRSIGSYSLRIYAATDPRFPYDHFITGIILPRNGSVETLLSDDIDGNGQQELIVTIRNAGSGSYLSVDLLQYRGRTLQLISHIDGLDQHADPIQTLKQRFRR